MWSRISWLSLLAVLAGVAGVLSAVLDEPSRAISYGLLGVIFALLALRE